MKTLLLFNIKASFADLLVNKNYSKAKKVRNLLDLLDAGVISGFSQDEAGNVTNLFTTNSSNEHVPIDNFDFNSLGQGDFTDIDGNNKALENAEIDIFASDSSGGI